VYSEADERFPKFCVGATPKAGAGIGSVIGQPGTTNEQGLIPAGDPNLGPPARGGAPGGGVGVFP